MVTLEQLRTMAGLYQAEFHYTGPCYRIPEQSCTRTVGPRGGITERVIRARVTGSLKTWKTRPSEFRLPVKHGMRDSGSINDSNGQYWHVAADCPLNQ